MPDVSDVREVIRSVMILRRSVTDQRLGVAPPKQSTMARSGELPKNFRALRFAPEASNARAIQEAPASRSGRAQTPHDAHTSTLTSMSRTAMSESGSVWCLEAVCSAYKRANHVAPRGLSWKAVSVEERGLRGANCRVIRLRSSERISKGSGDTSCPPTRRGNLPNDCVSRPEPSGGGVTPESAPPGSGRRTPVRSGTPPKTSNCGPVLTATARRKPPSGAHPQNTNAAAIPCQGRRRMNIAPRGPIECGLTARLLPNTPKGGRSVFSTVPAVSKQGRADRAQRCLDAAGQRGAVTS